MHENKKSKLVSYLFGAVFFLVLFCILIFSVDPSKASHLHFVFLYFFLAGFVYCTFTILISFFRTLIHRDLHSEKVSKREAALLALLVVGSLLLASRGLLFWWTAMIFAFALVLVEGFFLIS